jgi:integrase
MSQDNQEQIAEEDDAEEDDDLSCIDVNYGGHSREELEGYDTGNDSNIINIKRNAPDEFLASLEERNRSNIQRGKYKRVLTEFVSLLNSVDEHPCNITDKNIKDFNTHLKKETSQFFTIDSTKNELSDSTRAHYLSLLSAFYAWLKGQNVVEDNPARRVLKKLKESGDIDIEDEDRPSHELEEMRAFLYWLDSPFHRAWFLFLLKTGARRGGTVNVDLRDLHIDHPIYHHLLDEYNITLTEEVEDIPDSVHIMNNIRSGEVVRGEERWTGIKKGVKVGRTIPLDNELKTALLEYLLVRPEPKPSQPCHPLFLKTQRPRHGIGSERITKTSINRIVFGALEDYGWYESGAGVAESVDNHYFRHYFTVCHRWQDGFHDQHMPDPVLAYVRGDADSADTARNDDYSHSTWIRWHEVIEQPYLDNIYKFGIYD